MTGVVAEPKTLDGWGRAYAVRSQRITRGVDRAAPGASEVRQSQALHRSGPVHSPPPTKQNLAIEGAAGATAESMAPVPARYRATQLKVELTIKIAPANIIRGSV